MNKKIISVCGSLLLLAMVTGCSRTTGRSAGRTIDDATITTEVKGKLAAERPTTLTSVHVNTVNGTVYLSGVAPDAAAKYKAGELAREVDGVAKVVNNIQATAAGDVPGYRKPHSDREVGSPGTELEFAL